MNVDANELRTRTKRFALDVIDLFQTLPERGVGYAIGRQLLNCGTLVDGQLQGGMQGEIPG
jgi:hypothetical protein